MGMGMDTTKVPLEEAVVAKQQSTYAFQNLETS